MECEETAHQPTAEDLTFGYPIDADGEVKGEYLL